MIQYWGAEQLGGGQQLLLPIRQTFAVTAEQGQSHWEAILICQMRFGTSLEDPSTVEPPPTVLRDVRGMGRATLQHARPGVYSQSGERIPA